jgi:hypothetical protein
MTTGSFDQLTWPGPPPGHAFPAAEVAQCQPFRADGAVRLQCELRGPTPEEPARRGHIENLPDQGEH